MSRTSGKSAPSADEIAVWRRKGSAAFCQRVDFACGPRGLRSAFAKAWEEGWLGEETAQLKRRRTWQEPPPPAHLTPKQQGAEACRAHRRLLDSPAHLTGEDLSAWQEGWLEEADAYQRLVRERSNKKRW